VKDVEVGGVARAQGPVGEDMGMGAAALARDGVDALDELRAHLVEDAVDQGHALVLAHAWAQRAVELLIRGVDHHAGVVEQRHLVARLDHPGVLHELLAVGDLDALSLQREEHLRLDRVDADRLAEQVALLELDANLAGHVLGAPGVRRHRAAQGRDAGARAAVAEPRVVELVMAGGGAEVPHDRLVALGEQAEAVELVRGPRADVGGGDVADVAHVEAQQRAELGLGEQRLDPRQALLAQAVEAHALLPVDRHRAVALQPHLRHCRRSSLQSIARSYRRAVGAS
jgi:hypothetical protein